MDQPPTALNSVPIRHAQTRASLEPPYRTARPIFVKQPDAYGAIACTKVITFEEITHSNHGMV